MRVLEWILVAFVLAATLPPAAGVYQFLLAGLHRFRRDPGELTGPPLRVAVVIPAWNEAAVILRTIEYLLALDYPSDHLRIYVVDDASTDATPQIVDHPGPGASRDRPPSPSRAGRRGQGAHDQLRLARDQRR